MSANNKVNIVMKDTIAVIFHMLTKVPVVSMVVVNLVPFSVLADVNRKSYGSM